jgi:hypothetical protein
VRSGHRPDNEKPPTEVDGRGRTPGLGVRYEMTMTAVNMLDIGWNPTPPAPRHGQALSGAAAAERLGP